MDARTDMQRDLTREEAVALYDSEWWKGMNLTEAAKLQLHQDRLCMPFSDFQGAMEKLMGRPVWTHEFANRKALISELEGKSEPPVTPLHSLMEVAGSDALERAVVIGTD